VSWPTRVGVIATTLDRELQDRFPFTWWAQGAKFDYPEVARHLFCKCGSAAEAFFLRPFACRAGVTFSVDRAALGPVTVIPQRKALDYSIDFAVIKGETRLAVEVDGMAFHQRNADQVESDYLRSRRLIAKGWTVVRFTAPEVFRDAGECWRQLDTILDSRTNSHSSITR